MEDGAWMLWENSSVVAVVVVAHPDLGNGRFYYDSGASGVRGSIRLVFRVPTASGIRKVVVRKIKISKKTVEKTLKTVKTGIA